MGQSEAVAAEPESFADLSRIESALLESIDVTEKRVLLVGARMGPFCEALRSHGATELIAVQRNAGRALDARPWFDATYAIALDEVSELPYHPGYFDCIIVVEEFARCRDAERLLDTLTKYLARSGTLVANIPNLRNQLTLWSLLVEGRFVYRTEGVPNAEHLRFFTLDEARILFETRGYALETPLRVLRQDPSPHLPKLQELVVAMHGDGQRFAEEATVTDFLVRGQPTDHCAASHPPSRYPGDLWRGSRPQRVLLVPGVGRTADEWVPEWRAVERAFRGRTDLTVGLALDAAQLGAIPPDLVGPAEEPALDVVVIEAPRDDAGWLRLVAGSTHVVALPGNETLNAMTRFVGAETLALDHG